VHLRAKRGVNEFTDHSGDQNVVIESILKEHKEKRRMEGVEPLKF